MLKELKDTDREEISRLIKEGYTEGYLDTELKNVHPLTNIDQNKNKIKENP